MERGMNRLKVTLSRNVYQGYIDAIDKVNKDLRDITRQNVYLEPLRTSRKMKQSTADIQTIRRHAASLYQLLIGGTAWSCQCRQYHLASLRLESRSETKNGERYGVDSRYNFRILLAKSQQSHSIERTVEWQEIEIKPSTVECLDPGPGHGVPRPSRKVRFVTQTGKNEVSSEVSQHKSSSSSAQSTMAIVDICHTLCSNLEYDKPMGFLNYDKDKDYKHYLYRANTLPIDTS